MPISCIKTGLLAFVVYIVFLQFRHWYRWNALRKWGKQFNCAEPKSVPNRVPWGLERFLSFFFRIFFSNLEGVDVLDEFVLGRFKQMGTNTHRFWDPFNKTVLDTAEPENIQAILATQFSDFDLGSFRNDNFFDLLGNGIFTAERNEWRRFRHQLRPQFTRGQVSDLESANQHLRIMLKGLPEEDAEGWIKEVNLMPYLYRFVMDTATEFLFGQSVNSQTKFLHSLDSGNVTDAKGEMDFVSAMEYCQDYIMLRMRLGRLSWLYSSKDFNKACSFVKNYASVFVSRALNPEIKFSPSSDGNQIYVFLDELVKETQDPEELRDQVLHLLLAGRDTTSAMLSWTILLLSRHPDEFFSLRKAILSTFGTDSSPATPLTFESLKTCKAVTYVIYETIRLFPVIPMNNRMALKVTTLPVGGGPDQKSPIVVKKGELVSFSAYVLHRREDLWGRDAEKWKPERWVERKLGWEFIGFSGGPRVCLGQQYALIEAAFVIVKILQRYDRIEALDMTGKLVKGLSVTLKPGDGVNIKLHRAAE